MSIGMEGADDRVLMLFPKGSLIPAQYKLRTTTGYDNQASISFGICQGERLRFSQNYQMGSCIIPNLPPGLAKEVKVNHTFKLDHNEVFSIHAEVFVLNQKNQTSTVPTEFSIEMRRVRQSKKYTVRDVINRELHEAEDRKYLVKEKARGELKRFIQNTLNRLDRGYGCEEIETYKIRHLIREFARENEWVSKNENCAPIEYRTKLGNLDLLLPEKLQYKSYFTQRASKNANTSGDSQNADTNQAKPEETPSNKPESELNQTDNQTDNHNIEEDE